MHSSTMQFEFRIPRLFDDFLQHQWLAEQHDLLKFIGQIRDRAQRRLWARPEFCNDHVSARNTHGTGQNIDQ
jgi:hypothetical protein